MKLEYFIEDQKKYIICVFGQLNEKHQNSRVPLSSCSKRRSLAEVLQALSMTVTFSRHVPIMGSQEFI